MWGTPKCLFAILLLFMYPKSSKELLRDCMFWICLPKPHTDLREVFPIIAIFIQLNPTILFLKLVAFPTRYIS